MTSREKFQLQIQFCKENRLPLFCAINCYRCGKDVFEKYEEEYCKTKLITSCRHCNYSFVD